VIHYDTATETWTCDVCEWTFRARTPSIRAIAPRHGCPGPVDPAALTARLLAEIDAAIEAGQMAPWSHFPRDRAMVAQLLTKIRSMARTIFP